MMTAARSSYLKTIYLSVGGTAMALAVAVFAALWDFGALTTLAIAGGLVVSAIGAVVVVCGLVVLHRETRAVNGDPDLFLTLNRSRSEPFLASLSMNAQTVGRAWRKLFAPQAFVVGEIVEVRSWEEIQRTLDASGALEGVPFMTEMLPFCGQRARVLRGVDKVYDYGASKTLRRIDNCVLLVGFRCNGADHGGCQARCSIFWKTAWLKPAHAATGPKPQQLDRSAAVAGSKVQASGTQQERYVCQYTQVASSSAPMSKWDIRQDLRPLLAGNVTLRAFIMTAMTLFFNRVQGWRGGIPFPNVTNAGQARTPAEAKNIEVGNAIRVLGSEEIGKTLDATNRNRGLWFDREMIKHCHQPYKVSLRVERIIDDVTGRMVPMKTPCILLEDVVASGEFLRFLAQQEYLFWREVWLTKEPPQSVERQN